jgi:hypothetical protein
MDQEKKQIRTTSLKRYHDCNKAIEWFSGNKKGGWNFRTAFDNTMML